MLLGLVEPTAPPGKVAEVFTRACGIKRLWVFVEDPLEQSLGPVDVTGRFERKTLDPHVLRLIPRSSPLEALLELNLIGRLPCALAEPILGHVWILPAATDMQARASTRRSHTVAAIAGTLRRSASDGGCKCRPSEIMRARTSLPERNRSYMRRSEHLLR